MIKTTLNIHVDIMEKISRAAFAAQVPRRDVIVALLVRIMKSDALRHRGFSTVKYQPDDDRDKWHTFHICYKPAENEVFGDLRKFGKYSVSYLVAIAVEKYLIQMINGDKGIDNYGSLDSYVIFREVVDGIICWRLYWGYPSKEIQTLRL